MGTVARARTPAHLWIVGIVATLWNAFGAYDYLMTRARNMDYLAMSGIDPNAMLAYYDAFPVWAQIGWGLGVWGGVAGSLLLLARSRFAVLAFAISLFGMALGLGYQLLGPTVPAGMDEGMMAIFPYVIILVGVLLLLYSTSMARKGVLS